MAIQTEIQYCDSTLNLMHGCNGCELWGPNPGEKFTKHCYAGLIYEERAGRPGYAPAFDQPTIFPHRMDEAEKWKDLTGQDRPRKPWLNGMPRVIFVNDMGDTFSRPLDPDWIAPYVERMAKTPHIYLWLTKRTQAMVDFWKRYGKVPENIWLGTSITANANKQRAYHLERIPAKTKFLSLEPLLEYVDLLGIVMQLVIVGFESGPVYRDGNPDWMRALRDDCKTWKTPYFVKQMGGLRNHHGEMSDLPEDLRIRQMPEWKHLEWAGKSKPRPVQIKMI